MPTSINAQKLAHLSQQEQALFSQRNPISKAISDRANHHLMFGVPLHWMNDWSTPFALHVTSAQGATLMDADSHELIDFCLGDTGAMFGHSPPAVAKVLHEQATQGYTAMLPSEDAAIVGELLAEHFDLPMWQFAMTATDANRFVLRWMRALTKRPTLLVFNGCYHGTVDDVFVDLIEGKATQRDSLLGQVHDLTQTTRVIEFNDLNALEKALAVGDVACVLAEPVMTNIGMVLPEPDFWPQAIQLIHQYGSYLVMDETHTISSGPGGYCKTHGLAPDALVLGKPLAGGIPCAVYGFSEKLATLAVAAKRNAPPGHSGIGTTLTANMLAMKAMRATLSEIMTPATYAPMHQLAHVLATGLEAIIQKYQFAWCVSQVGARAEFQFCENRPLNGTQAQEAMNPELEHYIHLYLLNRGILITPFHNMMLICPATTHHNVQQLLSCFDEAIKSLITD
jgi:glutamate-1-semialdehyde 2,1-aminomutase